MIETSFPRWLRRTLTVLLLAMLGSASGCVYRLNIQQGNLLDLDQINQVTAGMTRSQVRYVLGTPMISDPFHAVRWDYIYTFQRGRKRNVDRAHFVVHFDGDTVAKVEKLDLSEAQQARLTGGAEPDREPPTVDTPSTPEAAPPPPAQELTPGA